MDGILLITNASAGSNEEQAVADAVDVLDKEHDVEVAATEDPEELAAVLDRCDGRPVVVAGGDGTLHAVVNGLYRAKQLESTCLGLVPLGTGNDFARGVGIPPDPAAAAQLVVDGHSSSVDLILSQDGTVIVNNVHLGVGAQASRKAEKWKPRLGKAGYTVGALAASLRPDFLHVDVFVDEEEVTLEEVVHDHLAQVAIGNGKYVGGGTALIPRPERGRGGGPAHQGTPGRSRLRKGQAPASAVSAEVKNPRPSVPAPQRSSTACSGWGMSPTTLPRSLATPAMSRSDPLGLPSR